ncbi:alpha/beta hydrolase [Solilutibacter silvestris]|uniref:alpha/beta hydrolase n=1 Tax=Solilutibacter silvestris TaxID=1645665 RepID=UPI003D326F1F
MAKAAPRRHLSLEERLTVRSSRPRFVAPPACLRYASTRPPPLAWRLNSGVRPMRWKRLAIVVVVLVAAGLVVTLVIGQVLISPAQHSIGSAPADLGAEPVKVESSVGPISGWLIRGTKPKGAVLLLHGVRSNRLQMVPRARWLKNLGYSVLLIDLPAHGETPGDHITFGFNEAKAVDASLNYLHQQFPKRPVGIIGVSLGAASTALSNPNQSPNAVVLESMYPTINDAINDRLSIHLGKFGPYFAPLLLWQIPARLDVPARELRPIDHLKGLSSPVLIASGTKDQHTRIDEARSIYQAASEPKEFWEVQGAAHVDLFDFDPATYKAHIEPFLQKYVN